MGRETEIGLGNMGIGMGLSLIGWIPDSEEEYYVNKEVGRSYARE